MDKILTIHQLPGAIIDLIEETRDYCYLVTPYFKPWTVLERALEKAANRQKRLLFVFRAGNLSPEMRALNERLGFDVYMVNNLHTKLYINERRAIITSMNLYDSSRENNFELGYVIDDSRTLRELKDKIIDRDILSLEPALHLPGKYKVGFRYSSLSDRSSNSDRQGRSTGHSGNFTSFANNQHTSRTQDNTGFCIRCHKPIPRNPELPLCERCYEIWRNYNNPNYPEHYCHTCGREAETSKNTPQCPNCRPRGGFFKRLGFFD